MAVGNLALNKNSTPYFENFRPTLTSFFDYPQILRPTFKLIRRPFLSKAFAIKAVGKSNERLRI
jgi:hypothetical protein